MRFVKIFTINIFVLFFIIIFLELTAGIMRVVIGKEFRFSVFFSEPFITSELHSCNKMKTDVLLNHVPNHEGKCFPKDASVSGEYVLYPSLSQDHPLILILGGSSTSGFYQHFSNGDTWPKLFSELVKDDYRVVNGAVGGYSSLQEFYKFSRDGSRFKNLKLVISLNGINEIPNYYGPDNIRKKNYPFLTNIQHEMNQHQLWIDQRVYSKLGALLPNLDSLYNSIFARGYVGENKNKKELSKNSLPKFFKPVEAAERWEINVKRLYSLAKIENADYFVFLQPTLGLIGPQSNPPKNSKDYDILNNLDENYLREIRKLYIELKFICKGLIFCVDISNEVAPTGIMYSDARHHNSKGNLELANVILKKLKELNW